jgi:hypothetical protein
MKVCAIGFARFLRHRRGMHKRKPALSALRLGKSYARLFQIQAAGYQE